VVTNVLEEHAASIFRAEVHIMKKETVFTPKVDNHLQDYTIPQPRRPHYHFTARKTLNLK
jgi:hypothetical protein